MHLYKKKIFKFNLTQWNWIQFENVSIHCLAKWCKQLTLVLSCPDRTWMCWDVMSQPSPTCLCPSGEAPCQAGENLPGRCEPDTWWNPPLCLQLWSQSRPPGTDTEHNLMSWPYLARCPPCRAAEMSFTGGAYHFVLCQVADTLSDPGADEVGGVAEEDGAARQGLFCVRLLLLLLLLRRLQTLLYLVMWSRQIRASTGGCWVSIHFKGP